tara:strand:- start:476 stop:1261 length:786 start_codon:yes stop_codon:yes gene_type:complete
MKITLFTKNNTRHNYLINLLSSISDELFVIQECETIFPGEITGKYNASTNIKKYFSNVNEAQFKLFGNSYINSSKKKIKILPIQMGDLNKCSLKFLSDFLESDIFIVFGSSYIKGDLIDFLIQHKTINIHMGVSPYYRGTDCNFWALFDDQPHLVGATIHLLSKGLDSGKILYHAMSNLKTNPYEYTMSTVKAAFHSIAERIKNNSLLNIDPIQQDKSKEIRYSKKIQFNDEVVKKYFKKEIDLNIKKFDFSMLEKPYFLN